MTKHQKYSALFFVSFLIACSSSRAPSSEKVEKPIEPIQAATPLSNIPQAEEQLKPQAPEPLAAKDQNALAPVAPVTSGLSPSLVEKAKPVLATVEPAHVVPDGVDPEKALSWLKNGNVRYLKHYLRKDGVSLADRQKLASSQHPHAIILSCSDSRVPPELVLDQKLGELFVVRTAGESLDESSIASIEYAVDHLGARLILVMGHTSCGAVKATLETPVAQSTGSTHMDKLLQDIRPHLSAFQGRALASASKDLFEESKANTLGVAGDLSKRSPLLQKALSEGRLMIKSAIYHLDTGVVDFL